MNTKMKSFLPLLLATLFLLTAPASVYAETAAVNELLTGWQTLNGNTYYYEADGSMVKGVKKIGEYFYYFDPNTCIMQCGFVKRPDKNKTCYYDQNGRAVFGLQRIGKYYYYFKPGTGAMKTSGFQYLSDKKRTIYLNAKGRMVTGLKKIKGKYYYFAKNGALKKKTFTVDQLRYTVTKKTGKITGFKIQEPAISQRPELPTGCEIVAWTMMVKHAGVKMSKMKAVNLMPRSSNPNAGFVGNPFSASGGSLVIYPGGLMQLTKKYLKSAVNLTGKSEASIKNKLRKGHIVLAWVRGLDGFGSHTIALTGYDQTQVYYNDPWTGTKRSMLWSSFLSMWNGNARRALSY